MDWDHAHRFAEILGVSADYLMCKTNRATDSFFRGFNAENYDHFTDYEFFLRFLSWTFRNSNNKTEIKFVLEFPFDSDDPIEVKAESIRLSADGFHCNYCYYDKEYDKEIDKEAIITDVKINGTYIYYRFFMFYIMNIIKTVYSSMENIEESFREFQMINVECSNAFFQLENYAHDGGAPLTLEREKEIKKRMDDEYQKELDEYRKSHERFFNHE